MEPRHEEQKDKVPQTDEKEAKPRRFRIVKLEERIAPSAGQGNASNRSCGGGGTCNPRSHCFCC
jgi:hypothetical protein